MTQEENIEDLIANIYGDVDPNIAEQSLEFLNQFQTSPDGFGWCITNFGQFSNPKSYLFSISVIKDWIQNQWSEISEELPRIQQIIFEISPQLFKQQIPLFLEILAKTMIRLMYMVYPQTMPDFLDQVINLPPEIIAAFLEELNNELIDKPDSIPIKEQMLTDGSAERLITFLEESVTNNDKSFLLPLQNGLKSFPFTNIEPCYTGIISNIKTFTTQEIIYSLNILCSVITIMPQEHRMTLIVDTGLIGIICELSSAANADDEDLLSAIGFIITKIEVVARYTEIQFVPASQIQELQVSQYTLDISPLIELSMSLFANQHPKVAQSVIPFIKNCLNTVSEIIQPLLQTLFVKLVNECSICRKETQFMYDILNLYEYVFDTLKSTDIEVIYTHFEEIVQDVPQNDSVFPFIAALFKLLSAAKQRFIKIPSYQEIVLSFYEVLDMDPPLSVAQVNALVSFETFFQANSSEFEPSLSQFALDALLGNILECPEDDEETEDVLIDTVSTLFQNTSFKSVIEISTEDLQQMVLLKNRCITSVCADYVNRKFALDMYDSIVQSLLEAIEDDSDIENTLTFMKLCKYHEESIQLCFTVLTQIAESTSQSDTLFALTISTANTVLGRSMQQFLSALQPVGFESSREYCGALKYCDAEFAAEAITQLAPILSDCLTSVSDWSEESSEEVRLAKEFHKSFFDMCCIFHQVESVQEAAVEIAQLLLEVHSDEIMMFSVYNFALKIPTVPFLLEYAFTFSQNPDFSQVQSWMRTVRTCYKYLQIAQSNAPELYAQTVESLGDIGTMVSSAVSEENDYNQYMSVLKEIYNSSRV